MQEQERTTHVYRPATVAAAYMISNAASDMSDMYMLVHLR